MALARAIVCEPKVILLDEPLAALDASLRRQMQLFLKQTQRQIRTTFVFVTHDQDEAIAMSDRIVVMNQGRIEQQGSPKDLYYRPQTRFVAGFFGDNNLIEGSVASNGSAIDTALGTLPFGKGCRLGARRQGAAGRAPGGFAPVQRSRHRCGRRRGRVRRRADPPAAARRRGAGNTPRPALTGDAAANVPSVGDRVSVSYDPGDAVIVAA